MKSGLPARFAVQQTVNRDRRVFLYDCGGLSLSKKEIHVQQIDRTQVRLKEPFDFHFIHQYGSVFRVFDEQSSGNLCFGVEKAGKKYFMKFAGARTINDHDLPVEDAVARLRAAVPKYKDLEHPSLIRLVDSAEVKDGYVLLFDWEAGESFGNPDCSLDHRFLSLPISQRVRVFEQVLRFHLHVACCGYVAIDFNHNSILYNFESGKVTVCDIDFYARQSYMNGMGGVFGIKTLMSPEESRCAGLLDEVTNVYTMGATAFMLLASGDRTLERWPLNAKLYEVVKRAVSDSRSQRQQSIAQLLEEWEMYSTRLLPFPG
jgi:serine/threonine protein kinase